MCVAVPRWTPGLRSIRGSTGKREEGESPRVSQAKVALFLDSEMDGPAVRFPGKRDSNGSFETR